MKKIFLAVCVVIVVCCSALLLTACNKGLPTPVDSSSVEQALQSAADKIDLTTLSKNVEADNITNVAPIETAVISKSGAYRFSGEYGNIIISESNLDLHFFFNNAVISNPEGVAVDGTTVKNTMLTLTVEEDTNNKISNDGDGNAVHIKGSLFVNGKGLLNVESNSKSCLKASKNIIITDASLALKAKNHAITGASVVAGHCAIDVLSAGKDGINAECDGATAYTMNDGFVALFDLNYTCVCKGDGVQADSWLYVNDGAYNITTEGNFVVNSEANKEKYGMEDDDFRYRKSGSTYVKMASDENRGTMYGLTQSCKGFKVGEIKYEDANKNEVVVTDGDYALMLVNGTFNLNCTDDAIHANSGDVYIYDGEYEIETLDDGITADCLTKICGGKITVKNSYEGIEGGYVEISGGVIDVTSSDDGINAASDDENVLEHIIISGGQVTVNASGDGLDSNGSLLISGGVVTVYGPTTNGDGGLDADGEIIVTGGTLVVTSSMGMAEVPSKTSTQNVVSYARRESIAANTVIKICDGNGNEVIGFTTAKDCQSIILSCADLKSNGTYSLYIGDSKAETFTVSSVITYVGAALESNRPNGGGMPPQGGPRR